MKTKYVLGIAEIERILAAARAEAERNNWAVTIAVADDGGHPLALLRLDNASASGPYIAQEKARTAALGRRETQLFEDMVNNGRTAFLGAPVLTPLGGGVPILVDGQLIGSVGVSGVKPDEDAQIARAGANSITA